MQIKEMAAVMLALLCLSGCLIQNSDDGGRSLENTAVASSVSIATDNAPPQTVGAYAVLSTDDQEVGGIAWSTDSRWIVIGTSMATVWDITTNKMVRRLERPDLPDYPDLGRITALRFSQDNTQLISGWGDGKILLWDVDTGDVLHELTGTGNVVVIELTNTPMRVVVGTPAERFSKLTLWDMETSEKLWEIKNLDAVSLAVNSDSSLLLAGTYNTTTSLIDIKTGEVLQTIPVFDAPFYYIDYVDFDEADSLFRTLGNNGILKEWSLESFANIEVIEPPTDAPLIYSSLNPATSLIASLVHGETEILIWNFMSGELVSHIEAQEGERFVKLAWSPNGQYIATVDFNGHVTIWEIF